MVSILICLISVQSAEAITISLEFLGLSGDSAVDGPSGFDPNATDLKSLMNYAKSYYEDVFEDPSHAITIQFEYADLAPPPTGDTLGLHTPITESALRETLGKVQIDTRLLSGGAVRSWYTDKTPANDSEFVMAQKLWRDIDGDADGDGVSNRSDWYNDFGASIPDTFEVGYRGNAVTGGPASGVWDMLSTVLHEVGHALGMSSGISATINQTTDGDYDFNPLWVFGESLSAETDNTSGDDNLDIAHLDDDFSLMGPSGISLRRRPSHTDLFAMASGNNYSFRIDVPRREMYGGVIWQTFANWSGYNVPEENDDALVRHGGESRLAGNAHVENLLVAEDSELNTFEHTLTVDDTTTIAFDGALPGVSRIVVEGGELISRDIEVTGGILATENGVITVDDDLVLAETDFGGVYSTLTGSGEVWVADKLHNDGKIEPVGFLFLQTTTPAGSDDVWNLDGNSGAGLINARNGRLVVTTGVMTDAFDGTMWVGAGQSVEFWAADFELGNLGQLNLWGTSSSIALLTASDNDLVIRGTVDVDGLGRLSASHIAFEGTGVAVDVLNDNDQFEIEGATTYRGGTFAGDGTIVQTGDAIFDEGAIVEFAVGVLDLDGTDDNAVITIRRDAVVSISADQIERLGDVGFDGVLNINSGTLIADISNQWTFEGELNLTRVDEEIPTIDGSAIVIGPAPSSIATPAINVTNTAALAGPTAQILAPVTFREEATLSITADSVLVLEGDTTYEGGTYNIDGTLQQNGDANVDDSTTLTANIFNMDGSEASPSSIVVAPLKTFEVLVNEIDRGDPSNDGYDGSMELQNGANFVIDTVNDFWRLDGSVDLNIANIFSEDDTIELHGQLTGTGFVKTPRVEARTGSMIDPGVVVIPASATLTDLGSGSGEDYTERILRIDGNFQQSLGSTLHVDVEIGTSSTIVDVLEVTGLAALAGMLEVTFDNSFQPDIGDQFTFLRAQQGLQGNFSEIVLSNFIGSGSWRIVSALDGLALNLFLAGDYNYDGRVDAADYVVWRKNEGTTNQLPNDPIGGVIGPAQYNIWRAKYGQASSSGSGASLESSRNPPVPEPRTFLLVVVGITMTLALLRR
jgi:hypothetical protein